jgi:archaellum component FlaC
MMDKETKKEIDLLHSRVLGMENTVLKAMNDFQLIMLRVENTVNRLQVRIEKVEDKLDNIDIRFERMQTDIAGLKHDVTRLNKHLGLHEETET